MMELTMVKTLTAFLALLAATTAMADDEFKAREEAAAAVATTFAQTLGATLKKHMAEDGPEVAITVCRDIAPDMANELSLLNGWKVTRLGTRVRNTMIGIPDAWEQSGLEQFEERMADGIAVAGMSYSDIVTEGNQRYFRFMKPIVTEPLCLSCHGTSDTISPTIQAVLNQQYPHDKAINYSVGELRGAVSIVQPMDQVLIGL